MIMIDSRGTVHCDDTTFTLRLQFGFAMFCNAAPLFVPASGVLDSGDCFLPCVDGVYSTGRYKRSLLLPDSATRTDKVLLHGEGRQK